MNHNNVVDRSIMVLTLVGVSMPIFWLGLLLIWIFAVHIRWFPSGGYVPLFENVWQGSTVHHPSGYLAWNATRLSHHAHHARQHA